LASRFAAEGARVVLGDLDTAKAEEAVHAIVAEGGEALAVHLDGADEWSIANAVSTAQDHFGGLDGLHANFACMADSDPDTGVLELSLNVFDETMRVNARGFFLCTREALPPMIARGGGAILYTSSAAANGGGTAQLSYAMSKSAGHALMRHVARRFGPVGIRANTIAPALTLHPSIEAYLPPAILDMAMAAASIKSRVGRPDDIASIATLLMSEEGGYITGQVISVDGGTTMRA
jgi:NAD(P)-dependent dehydrogenase (short-subunit alcohol dehydrogenase family)